MANNYSRFTMPIKSVPSDEQFTAIILGANVELRQKGLGPKSLIPVSDTFNVIETQMDSIRTAYPKCDMLLVTGYQTSQIVSKRYPIKIVENPFFEETSEVEQIRIGLNAVLSNKVLFVGGDLVFDPFAINKITTHGSCTLFNPGNHPEEPDLGVVHHNNVLENVVYYGPQKWYNCLYLEGKELEAMRKFAKNKERSKLSMFEAINFLVGNKTLIRTLAVNEGTMYYVGKVKE